MNSPLARSTRQSNSSRCAHHETRLRVLASARAEQKDEFPISAWEEEDYLAATEVDDEDEDEERIPWEDYDQDDLNKMDRQLSRGY